MLITPFKVDMIIDNLLILLKEEMYALGCVSAHQDWHQTSHLPMLSPHTHTIRGTPCATILILSQTTSIMKAGRSIERPSLENWKVGITFVPSCQKYEPCKRSSQLKEVIVVAD